MLETVYISRVVEQTLGFDSFGVDGKDMAWKWLSLSRTRPRGRVARARKINSCHQLHNACCSRCRWLPRGTGPSPAKAWTGNVGVVKPESSVLTGVALRQAGRDGTAADYQARHNHCQDRFV